nr:CtsR family transcriptional regulator [Bacilli bacterium]
MRSTSDRIEEYLYAKLSDSANGVIEIQRNDLAQLFACVPSQINYVIATRFTLERGYVVESKRGGGGYIRIKRLAPEHIDQLGQLVLAVGELIAQKEAEGIVWRLESDELLSSREADIMRVALSRDVLALPLPERDRLRARLLSAMLTAVFAHEQEEG